MSKLGRPTETEEPTAASLNARVTGEQMEYLRDLADELGASLSAAVRRAIDRARLLDMATQDYRRLEGRDRDPDDGTTALWKTVVALDPEPVDEHQDEDQV